MIQKNKKIIAIIPARSGSKGLPRKNIKLLAGKPLIAYSIEVALNSKYIDKTIVSTDDEEIASVSKKCGAEVIKRPKILSTDRAKTIDAVFHVLDALKRKDYNPSIIVLLQPTSPLRTVNDTDKTIKLFLKNKCSSVISVSESEHPLYWFCKIKGKYLKPFWGWKYFNQRQNLPKAYIPNGAIYISIPQVLHKYKSFYSNKTLPYIMPPERSVDIDNEIDFMLAELIIKNEKNKNRK